MRASMRRMPDFRRTAVAAALLTVVVALGAHCGGSTSSPGTGDAGSGSGGSGSGSGSSGSGSSGSSSGVVGGSSSGAVTCAGSGKGTPAETPAEHRSAPATCTRTVVTGFDGGSCNGDADCQDASLGPNAHCVEHVCGEDECLVDADCAAGTICICSSDVGGGNGLHVNRCVPSNCTTDGDCGSGNYCVPSRGYCGGADGFYCTSGSDTCVVPQSDCACGGNACVYAPEVGHFACGATTCSG